MKLITKITSAVLATITGAVAVTQAGPIPENVSQSAPTVQSCTVVENICPKIQTAVDWAIEIANNPSHGYDQINRWGPDDYDCSSLVISAFKNSGIDTGNASYTGNMYSELTSHGFTAYEFRMEDLQYGDILLTDGHTELFIGGSGELVGANANENYGKGNGKDAFKNGIPGDQTGKEIYTKPYYDDGWYWILRYMPKWYDWLDNPNLPDNFYAFIENGGSVLSSSGGTMHLESENGNEQQIWYFTRESGGCYSVSNADNSGSYNLYQDDTGSIIFNASGSEMACLTASADVVQTSDYDSCSDAQRFTIRPVSDPIMVEYDFGGSSCPIIEEHYGEPYKGAFDLTWMTGFVGWFDENGNKVDASSIVTNPYAHKLTARFDEEIQPTIAIEETTTESTTVVLVTNSQYNAPLELESTTTATTANRTTTASTTTPSTTKTTTATTKMTTTKTTTSKATTTSYKATTTPPTTTTIKYGDWSSWSRELPPSSDSNIEVEARDVLIGYEMLYFCIKDAQYGNRVYRDYSIADVLAEWGGSTAYGEHSFMTWNATPTYFYSSEYIDSRPTVAPGEWLNYGQSGINAGNSIAYVVEYGPNTILAYKSHEVYETQYRYRTVNVIKG